jgi:hypothetical protein
MRDSMGITGVLAELQPESLIDYLERHGWHRAGKKRLGVGTWVRGRATSSNTTTVLIPLARSLPDFIPLLERAVLATASFEDRPVDDLLTDLTTPSAAIVRLGAEFPERPELGVPVEVASAMIDTLISAARNAAAETAANVDVPWRGTVVDQYVESVRLEHTEPGSFVMKAVLPNDLGLANAQLWGLQAVPDRMVQDLQLLRRLLEHDAPRSKDETLIELSAWPFGSDVVGALGRLGDDRVDAATFRVRLPSDGPRKPESTVRFDGWALAQARAISHALSDWTETAEGVAALRSPPTREQEIEEHEVVVDGLVVQLARPAITISAVIDNAPRRVRVVDLPEDSYLEALEAHRLGRPILVQGTLRVRPRSATLRHVVLLRMLER